MCCAFILIVDLSCSVCLSLSLILLCFSCSAFLMDRIRLDVVRVCVRFFDGLSVCMVVLLLILDFYGVQHCTFVI